MKRKVGTTIDEGLYQRVKDAARAQGRSVNEILAEALERFLNSRSSPSSVVRETRGAFKVSARTLRAVMEEDMYEAR